MQIEDGGTARILHSPLAHTPMHVHSIYKWDSIVSSSLQLRLSGIAGLWRAVVQQHI